MNKKIGIIGQNILPTPSRIPNFDVVSITDIFKKANFIQRFVRAIVFRLNLNCQSYFYNIDEVADKCKSCDIVILHDSMSVKMLNVFMKRIEDVVNKDSRLILYFWNTVVDYEELNRDNGWEILTFDISDSKKYNLNYAGGFFSSPNLSINNNDVDNYLYFLGEDGGRFKSLRRFERVLSENGKNTKFFYFDPIKSLFSNKFSGRVPYSDNVMYLLKAMAIVEWMKPNQKGLTLRTYESLFFHKKMITNNESIKNYSFYDPSFIFVVSDGFDISGLDDFLKRPINFDAIEKYQRFYSYESWLNRIVNRIEVADVIKD